ncbi:hypothetical protein HRE53_18320 [Acaryochloris sp. 'Moss Beach']|uniref:Tic22 family protein n=1 Tax=Acaryochloris TaxID=155977 RepID=UPI001BAF8632|nr:MULTISPECIES: Tic22 family protein [Acaryochloris]QUY43684.1 hypothetical protein I1H34_06030 [Acaryochloris marina S15]UJB68473.1 hypothetical protein HRE53_18320 [Acaryochloris sp. 'Moss Beach']
MKGLIRWGLIVSLAGGGFVGTSLVQQEAAIAIPEAEAVKRLETVPTFAVTDAKGSPVLAAVPNPKDKTKKIQVATFFMSQTDAQNLVNNLKANKPEIGKSARVTLISLRDAYEITKKNKDKQDELVFQFIPNKEQVDLAKAILKQEGQDVKQFQGVPMFFAIGGKEKGLLTIEQGKEKIIPFYFRKQDLQGMIDQLKKQNNPLSGTTKIQVTSLDRLVGSLFKSEDATAKQIVLIPSRDALEYAVQQQKKNGAQPQKPSATPAATPKK